MSSPMSSENTQQPIAVNSFCLPVAMRSSTSVFACVRSHLQDASTKNSSKPAHHEPRLSTARNRRGFRPVNTPVWTSPYAPVWSTHRAAAKSGPARAASEAPSRSGASVAWFVTGRWAAVGVKVSGVVEEHKGSGERAGKHSINGRPYEFSKVDTCLSCGRLTLAS